MRRFESDSLYYKCYSEILERARNAELQIEAEAPSNPAVLRGLFLRQSLPLVQNIPWWIAGQFQCSGLRYLDFYVAGVDRPVDGLILSFTLSIYDVNGVPDELIAIFTGNPKNAALVWEYTSGVEALDLTGVFPFHVHRFNTPERRYYQAMHPEPMSPEFFGTVLDDAILAIPAPETFWHTLNPNQPVPES